jgi:acetyl-CoA carboxylase beta subunit
MTIKFHCNYCRKKIEAPDKAGGKWGKCPSCHNKIYIPDLNVDGDLKLQPVDEEEEKRKKELMNETFQIEQTILNEKELDANGNDKQSSVKESAEDLSEEQIEKKVIKCLRNMVDGKLKQVELDIPHLVKHSKKALEIIDKIAVSQLPPPELEDVPEQVLAGFIRNLRGKIS